MYSSLCLVVLFASSPVLTAVVSERENFCSENEFSCSDGVCITFENKCDGIAHCADGSDEYSCYSSPNLLIGDTVLHRERRQATTQCSKSQWQCRDGTCIGFDGKCDGNVDCPDGSDETHALCRNTRCQSNWFRCTYGACVDGTAACNGKKECADNSDELQPKCLNGTDEVQGRFKCQNGELIPASSRCDGTKDCNDGSDETVRACAANKCPSYLFQCAYGACVDQGSDCNGKNECADGSDESNELCNRMGEPDTKPVVTSAPSSGACVLPAYPQHGSYVVTGAPNASPGQTFETVQINVSCIPGYGVVGKSSIICYNGIWTDDIPKCVRFCRLNKHPSVEYRCLITGDGTEGTRECRDYEPSDTIVRPECRSPNYYYSGVLKFMRCIDGGWDYVAICSAECGRVTPSGEQLIIDGWSAKRGEVPWHAGIYRKTTDPFEQICGGTLVTNTVIVSAAHCFWSDVDKILPASRFAVAVGKLYRPWGNPHDADAQKSDVRELKIPVRFQGVSANFQDDIALVILMETIIYQTYIRPICIDFDIIFDRQQLREGNKGKVAGWGLTAENGRESQVLKVVELPYVKIETCISQSPPDFREYITSDKICAGYGNGTALCKGDSGGGLAFPEWDRGIQRYYLRGVVSTAPRNDNKCNANALMSFTQLTKHEYFIKEWISL